MMLETIFADVQRWALAHFSRWKRVAQWALCDKKKQHWTTSVDRTEKWIPWADILPVVSYISRQLWCLPSPKGGAGQCSSSYRHWALKIPRGELCHGGGGEGEGPVLAIFLIISSLWMVVLRWKSGLQWAGSKQNLVQGSYETQSQRYLLEQALFTTGRSFSPWVSPRLRPEDCCLLANKLVFVNMTIQNFQRILIPDLDFLKGTGSQDV